MSEIDDLRAERDALAAVIAEALAVLARYVQHEVVEGRES